MIFFSFIFKMESSNQIEACIHTNSANCTHNEKNTFCIKCIHRYEFQKKNLNFKTYTSTTKNITTTYTILNV